MTALAGVTAVLLAGGMARRMGGGDKCLLEIGGRTLLDLVIERTRSQTPDMVINANGDSERFNRFDLPVAADTIDGFAGPLAGVLTGMEWAHDNCPGNPWVMTVATDTPFFPRNLMAAFLKHTEEGADMACAQSDGRNHPVFGLWPVHLAGELRTALIDEEIRKVDVWTARYRLAVAPFSAEPFDPFFNVNRPEDLEIAERQLQANT